MRDGGKHAHWAEFDESLEQASWNAIQAAVDGGAVPTPDMPEAVRLAEYARSYGYGEADSHVSDLGVEAPEDEAEDRAARREAFEAYMDGPYWNHVDRSQRILAAAGEGRTDGEAIRRGADAVAQSMRDGFEAGRKERLDMEASAAPAP